MYVRFLSAAVMACNNRQFKCNDKTCIDGLLVCDVFLDCPDGSDEGPHCGT